MELQQLITFHTIVQQGSFSGAAKTLGYTQAAITTQIRNLEQDLGVRLFDRLGRNIALTSDGKTFHRHTLKILTDISTARNSVAAGDVLNGHLTIGTIDSLCTSLLMKPVEKFHEAHPNVRLSITTESIEGLLAMLSANKIDFAYLVDHSIQNPSFRKILEKKEKAVFLCSSSHPLANVKKAPLEEVLSCPLLLTEKDTSYRRIMEYDLLQKGYEVCPSIESRNTDLILNMIRDNIGITFLPKYIMTEHPKREELAVISTRYEAIMYRQILCHRDKWISEEMKQFFQFID